MALNGHLSRIWMTNRAPYNIVCLDYLVYLVYIATGSIGGNGSIRLLVVSVDQAATVFRRIGICVYLWYLEYRA